VLTGEAGQILNCSANHVRYLERTGQLEPARRVGWLRLFNRQAVEALARDRYRKATGQPHYRGNPWELGQK
jgi:DNA-binding transcriptional MerR regulator